jgi:KUP system potassium uptake protein
MLIIKANKNFKKILMLTLGALGVVYGDIGTSPLYAINEIFFGPSHTPINKLEILGAISLVFWALTIIICIKYVILVLQADSDGEGGVYALYSLIVKRIEVKSVLWNNRNIDLLL